MTIVTRPIPRRNAFFGLRFDLHPRDTDTSLGADTWEHNIETPWQWKRGRRRRSATTIAVP